MTIGEQINEIKRQKEEELKMSLSEILLNEGLVHDIILFPDSIIEMITSYNRMKSSVSVQTGFFCNSKNKNE